MRRANSALPLFRQGVGASVGRWWVVWGPWTASLLCFGVIEQTRWSRWMIEHMNTFTIHETLAVKGGLLCEAGEWELP